LAYFSISGAGLQQSHIRKWVPELKDLDSSHIHAPWETSSENLEKAGVQLGTTYPFPIIEHSFARKRALDAFKNC